MLLLIEGILVPHITPFDDEEDIDGDALREIVDYFIEGGVHGLVTLGSNGEFPYLNREEKEKVLRIVVDQVNGRVPVIGGTACPSTRETMSLTREAWDIGVDAVIIAPPYYFKPSPKELYYHYASIIESTDVPLIIYNVPKFTGYNMPIDVIERLTDEYSQIIGIKDSSGLISRVGELIRLLGDKISILAGTGDLIYPSLVLGAHGAVVAIANVAPRLCVELYNAFREMKYERARKIQIKLNHLNEVLIKKHNQLSAIKEAMNILGLNVGFPRRPMLPLSEEGLRDVEIVLEDVGLI
ncbi:4-hydroxy-tetrahydrodipicolinate synthase [Palaeococcus sp. (in: euryarchaeotes)]